MERMGRTDQLVRYSDGRYLTLAFTPLRSQGVPRRFMHGSLEGVGGLKTNEEYHSKADALVIPEMYFF